MSGSMTAKINTVNPDIANYVSSKDDASSILSRLRRSSIQQAVDEKSAAGASPASGSS